MKLWRQELFGIKSRLPRKTVEDSLTDRIYYLL